MIGDPIVVMILQSSWVLSVRFSFTHWMLRFFVALFIFKLLFSLALSARIIYIVSKHNLVLCVSMLRFWLFINLYDGHNFLLLLLQFASVSTDRFCSIGSVLFENLSSLPMDLFVRVTLSKFHSNAIAYALLCLVGLPFPFHENVRIFFFHSHATHMCRSWKPSSICLSQLEACGAFELTCARFVVFVSFEIECLISFWIAPPFP